MIDVLDEIIAALIIFIFAVFTALILPDVLGSFLVSNPQHMEQEQRASKQNQPHWHRLWHRHRPQSAEC